MNFLVRILSIKEIRKPDAHAATISDSDFKLFRDAMEWLEEEVDNYFKMFS